MRIAATNNMIEILGSRRPTGEAALQPDSQENRRGRLNDCSRISETEKCRHIEGVGTATARRRGLLSVLGMLEAGSASRGTAAMVVAWAPAPIKFPN